MGHARHARIVLALLAFLLLAAPVALTHSSPGEVESSRVSRRAILQATAAGSTAGRINSVLALVRSIPRVMADTARLAGSTGVIVSFGFDGTSRWYATSTAFTSTSAVSTSLKTSVDAALGGTSVVLTRLSAAPSATDLAMWLLRGSVTLRYSDDTATFNLTSSRNALFLLSDMGASLGVSALGLSPPAINISSAASASTTTSATIVTNLKGNLTELRVGLSGSWGVSSLAKLVGLTAWDAANAGPDFVLLTGPTLSFKATKGTTPAALEFAATVGIPSMAVAGRDAVLSYLNRKFTLALPSPVSFAGGLANLTKLQLEASTATGLNAMATGEFMGIAGMNVTVTLPAAKGVAATWSLRKTNTNIEALATSLKARAWPLLPDWVVTTLKGFGTLPSFEVKQLTGVNAGQYFANATTSGGASLALLVDANGLRSLRLALPSSSCLNLADVTSSLGLTGVSVPADVFRICGPYVAFIPQINGVPAALGLDGKALTPIRTAGFKLSMPDLKISNVDALLALAADAAQAAVFSLRLPGTFTALDGYASLSDLAFSEVARAPIARFRAAATISLPSLGISATSCALSYSTGTYNFTLSNRIAFAGGLGNLTNLQLEASAATGLKVMASAEFMGIGGMQANATLPAALGAAATWSLRKTNTNIEALATSLKARAWPLLPDWVATTLKGFGTLPSFEVKQLTGVNAGQYFANATTSGGASLALLVDANGLRSLRLALPSSSCLNLADVTSSLGLIGVSVPADVFRICGPYIAFIPQINGVPAALGLDGKALTPIRTAGFKLSMPDLKISNVDALLALAADAAQAAVFSLRLPGTFTALDGYASLSDLAFSEVARAPVARFRAAATISLPSLGISAASCALSYSNGTYSFATNTAIDVLPGYAAISNVALTYARGTATSAITSAYTASFLGLRMDANVTATAGKLVLNSLKGAGLNLAKAIKDRLWSAAPDILTSLLGSSTNLNVTQVNGQYYTALQLPAPSRAALTFMVDAKGLRMFNLTTDAAYCLGLAAVASATFGVTSVPDVIRVCGPSFQHVPAYPNFVGSALETDRTGAKLTPGSSAAIRMSLPDLGIPSVGAILSQATNASITVPGPITIPGGWATLSGLTIPALGSGTSFRASAKVSVPAISLSNVGCEIVYANDIYTYNVSGSIVNVAGVVSLANILLRMPKGAGNGSVNSTTTFPTISARGSFLSLTMEANATIKAGNKINVALRTSNINLAATVQGLLSALGPLPSWNSFLTSQLGALTFPSFDVTQFGDTQFSGAAAMATGTGLAFIRDSAGLRALNLTLGSSSCFSLSDLASQLGFAGVSLPTDVIGRVCGPMTLQHVPTIAGALLAKDASGRVLSPNSIIAFRLAIPDLLGPTPVAASLSVAPNSTFQVKLDGSFSVFDGWATLKELNIQRGTASSYNASATIAISDLGGKDVPCTFTYDKSKSSYVVKLAGNVAFLFDTVTLTALTINYTKGTKAVISGTATGSLGGVSGSSDISYTYNPITKKWDATRLSYNVTQAVVLRSIATAVPQLSTTVMAVVPKAVLDLSLPKVSVATTSVAGLSNVYSLTAGPSSTGITASVYFDGSSRAGGVLAASLTLAPSLDLGSVITTMLPDRALTLPVDANLLKGLVTITNPQLVYVGSNLAAAKALVPAVGNNRAPFASFGLQLPLMGIKSVMPARLPLADASNAQVVVAWEGKFSPITGLNLTSAALALSKANGVVLSANGSLFDTAMAVTLRVPSTKSFSVAAEARNLVPANLLRKAFPSTPSLILTVLDPVSFSLLRVTYQYTEGSSSTFGIEGSPDLTKLPATLRDGLNTVLKALGLSLADVQIAVSNGQLSLALTKTWTFAGSSPFQGPVVVGLGLAVSGTTTSMAVTASGSFQARVRMSFLNPEVISLGLGASVAFKTGTGASFGLSASVASTTSQPIAIKNFNWIKVSKISGSISLTPALVPDAFSLTAAGTVFSAPVTVILGYDANSQDFGILFSMTSFRLQNIVDALGVNANLGLLDFEIRRAFFAYAAKTLTLKTPVSGYSSIPQGLRLAGDIQALGTSASLDLMVATNGFKLEFTKTGSLDLITQLVSMLKTDNQVLNYVIPGLAGYGPGWILSKITSIVALDRLSFAMSLMTTSVGASTKGRINLAGYVNYDFNFGLSFSTDPVTAIKNELIKGVKNAILTDFCLPMKQTSSEYTGSGSCPAGYVTRYYRGNDMVPYSYCVQACGPSETDGTGSLGGGKTTVASYEDLKKCWYCSNGKTPEWSSVWQAYLCPCSGWFCSRDNAISRRRAIQCGAGKVEYMRACFPTCNSGYVREGEYTDFGCYQKCAGRYNTRCSNGYICASGGSCPIVPSPSSVKACPANLASTSDADVDFSYQPADLSDLPAEVVGELSDELPDEILMQMPPSPAPAPAATTRAPSPSPAPTPSPQTVTADRASTARQQDNTTSSAASSADPASVPQTSDAQLQAAALATDTPADVTAPETGSAASAGGTAQTTAAGSSSGTASTGAGSTISTSNSGSKGDSSDGVPLRVVLPAVIVGAAVVAAAVAGTAFVVMRRKTQRVLPM